MLRLWAIFGFIATLYGLVLVRLFYWQIIIGSTLRVQAAAQYAYQLTIPATRGQILASDGSPFVVNQPAYLLYGQPKEIQDMDTFVRELSPRLSVDASYLRDQLSVPNRIWVPIAHKVDGQVAQELMDLSLKGLGFEKEPKRYYPESSMAAHLLGFVGSDQNGDDTGYFGIEGFYDRELRGKDGLLELERDVRGAPILVGEAKRIEPEHGRSLTLWLDRAIQFKVEQKLLAGIEKYGAKEGSVVVMDPKTGGILAMAQYPSYEPARYSSYDKELYKNPMVASSYEPGSTFKALVMSAALEEKAVTPQTIVDESGPLRVDEYMIRTWNDQYHGPITMTKVLEYSSNVGMVFVGRTLGKEKLVRYLHNFGIGELTGIDLQDEASPTIREDNEWKQIDVVTASFGQGIAVTPLQMVRAVAALANDGWLMEPHVVKEVRDSRGKVIQVKPKNTRRVIERTTANIITEMLVSAVDNGEAKWAKPKGYRIAGKTGTAQIPVAGHYDENKTIASFVGFAPADNPKFAMLVTLREPTSSPWGSETAAPLFFTIAQDLFSYFGIAPTE